jgi:hypothetical protein
MCPRWLPASARRTETIRLLLRLPFMLFIKTGDSLNKTIPPFCRRTGGGTVILISF